MSIYVIIIGVIQTLALLYIVWLHWELRADLNARWPELVKLLLDYEREVLDEARAAKTPRE